MCAVTSFGSSAAFAIAAQNLVYEDCVINLSLFSIVNMYSLPQCGRLSVMLSSNMSGITTSLKLALLFGVCFMTGSFPLYISVLFTDIVLFPKSMSFGVRASASPLLNPVYSKISTKSRCLGVKRAFFSLSYSVSVKALFSLRGFFGNDKPLVISTYMYCSSIAAETICFIVSFTISALR